MTALLSGRSSKLVGLVIAFLLLLISTVTSILYGILDTDWQTAIDAYINFNGSNEHIVIKDVRVPRALIAAAVGASLGIAGALLQSLTRNPVADLGVFGINSGAALFIVVAVSIFSVNSLSQFTWIAFAGAAFSGIAVYVLGSLGRDGLTPLKLTLAGSAIYALASSLTSGLLVANQQAMEEVLFWLAGSVAGRKLEMLAAVFPYMLLAWLAAFLLARPINTLMLGEDVAKGLGQKTALVKVAAGMLIILLAGSSVAVAGPISFVGLIIPHVSRYLVGIDTRWVFAYSAFLGAILLLAADIGARCTAMPKELPIGVMTVLAGAPFFIHVARKGLSRG